MECQALAQQRHNITIHWYNLDIFLSYEISAVKICQLYLATQSHTWTRSREIMPPAAIKEV